MMIDKNHCLNKHNRRLSLKVDLLYHFFQIAYQLVSSATIHALIISSLISFISHKDNIRLLCMLIQKRSSFQLTLSSIDLALNQKILNRRLLILSSSPYCFSFWFVKLTFSALMGLFYYLELQYFVLNLDQLMKI